jgi:putative FmdB family regulatory protein
MAFGAASKAGTTTGRTHMPKYDYRCSACGITYEKREGFDAPSLQECPQCKGQARRVLTPPAIVFKGSGWYVNDSRKDSPRDAAGTASTETKSESKTETKSETKSETRSESKSDSSASSTPSAAAAD